MPPHNPCRVSFKVSTIGKSEIPGITSYLSTLARAKDSWKNNQSVSEYLAAIEEYANQDELDVLYIIDNGKGFDKHGLEAVLAEGTPEKQDGSSGSFGIGHLTAFGLSGLQYIYYLGKKSDKSIVSAGHAILSSSEDAEGSLRSHSGYFVRENRGTFDDPFDFCDETDTPDFLMQEANNIEESGSIVAILGFKGFQRKKKSDRDTSSAQIREAVAENFAIAIWSGSLEITVDMKDDGDSEIDKSKIEGFLRWMARDDTGDRKSTKEAQWTLEAIDTYRQRQHVGTPGSSAGFQDCEIYQRNGVKSHSVSIWRNGMLITKSHSGLSKGMFVGKKPINTVILLSGKKNPREAHDIVKKAETPLHDKIQEKRLSKKKEKQKLKDFLASLRVWISEHAEDSGGSTIDLDDEIVLDAGSTGIFRTPKSPRSRVRDDDMDDDSPEYHGEGRKPKRPGGATGDRAQGARGKRAVGRKNHTPARIQGKRVDESYRLRLLPEESTKRAILEVLVDSGQDASCVGLVESKDLQVAAAVRLIPAKENEPMLRQKCDIEDGRVVLENLKKNEATIVELQFHTPLMSDVSLDCRMGRYQKETDSNVTEGGSGQ